MLVIFLGRKKQVLFMSHTHTSRLLLQRQHLILENESVVCIFVCGRFCLSRGILGLSTKQGELFF